ncbi:MAG: hypothetical protein QS748_07870 [Candidatus Endonucleobacter bathymodioli]|uniref:Uncharacterized protein n=1 Tax=Candidatus Endonucleibacter bathymodioli TaxID=539814 RepID=A0AA90NLW6_9GAMM|nr:hypothetical protein [Candidatus Endonucleobacter bathymodioli]
MNVDTRPVIVCDYQDKTMVESSRCQTVESFRGNIIRTLDGCVKAKMSMKKKHR